MDRIINNLANLDLTTIGDPNFDVNLKRDHLRQIQRINYNGGPDINPFNLFNNWDEEKVESFNRVMIRLQNDLEFPLTQSKHGILDAGSYYSTYTFIGNHYRNLLNSINAELEIDQQQKNIFVYILLPVLNLPIYNSNFNPDKGKGEKTFSKMLLNIAFASSKNRFESIEGYWRCYQQHVIIR